MEQKNLKDNENNNINSDISSNEIYNNKNNKQIKESIIFSNTQEFSSGDTLFGNNYAKYYLNNKILSSKTCFDLRPKKMGNLYVFLFINNQPIFAIGNNKLYLVIIYELVLHFSFFILMKTIIKSLFLYMKIMLISFYLNCFICHMFIYLINPGIPNIKYYAKKFIRSEQYIKLKEKEKKNYYLCEICNIIVNIQDAIQHCEECDICIKQLDHHCYWTGKCIAKNNVWAFNLFSLGTLLYIVWYFIMIIYWIILQIAHYNSLNKQK